jgi:hypothetical protein
MISFTLRPQHYLGKEKPIEEEAAWHLIPSGEGESVYPQVIVPLIQPLAGCSAVVYIMLLKSSR